MHLATEAGTDESIKFLLAHGANINAQGEFNRTPLHNAVIGHYVSAIKILVNAGADQEIKDLNRFTPFDYAYRYGGPDITSLLNPASLTRE